MANDYTQITVQQVIDAGNANIAAAQASADAAIAQLTGDDATKAQIADAIQGRAEQIKSQNQANLDLLTTFVDRAFFSAS